MNKNIATFAYANAIAGILAELTAFVPNPFDDMLTGVLVRNFFEGYWLGYFEVTYVSYRVADTGGYLNIINLIANVLLLVGAMQFSKTSGAEVRLIRCMLGVLLVSSIYSVIEIALHSQLPVYGIASGLKCAALAFGSWVFLRKIATTRVVQTIGNAPKNLRILNWLGDTTIVMLAMSPFTTSNEFVRYLEQRWNLWISMAIFLIVIRFIYYVFFESFFGATPGKFLTETRVVDDNNGNAGIGMILRRTLARFIPFDGLSFLGRGGWHDSLSYTKVVQEESTIASPVVVHGNVIDRME